MWRIWTKSTLSAHTLYPKCPPLVLTHVRCLPRHWSIASSKIDCSRPHQTSMSRCYVHTMDLSVVDTMLHDRPSRNLQNWDLGCLEATAWTQKVWCFLTQQFNCCMCATRCAGALSCWNTKSLPETLHIDGSSMTSWHREAAKEMSVRDITRISCFVTRMKLPHALQIYSTVFVTKCMQLHFSRYCSKKTIGEAGNSIVCSWANNFYPQQWKNCWNWTVFSKVMLKWTSVQLFWLTV